MPSLPPQRPKYPSHTKVFLSCRSFISHAGVTLMPSFLSFRGFYSHRVFSPAEFYSHAARFSPLAAKIIKKLPVIVCCFLFIAKVNNSSLIFRLSFAKLRYVFVNTKFRRFITCKNLLRKSTCFVNKHKDTRFVPLSHCPIVPLRRLQSGGISKIVRLLYII